ncbi:TetR/AcrR family transcriptional regulator [Rhodococcus sp. NPDC127593]|uniref:TetR/AcrR family transcriptional regulator n=1 Tax=Rhodococcus sp. NPDC127593 TaxID=3345404 RepID=UPI00363547B8
MRAGVLLGRGSVVATRRHSDRKQQILAVASELFREHGYHNVSVVDVTTKVDISASALYRHYRNKHDLLYYAVLSGLDSLQESVSGSTDLDALLSTLSVTSTGRRGLPILWQREARYLEGEPRADLRTRLRAVTVEVSRRIAVERPDLSAADCELLAYSVLALFSSVSGHRVTLPRRRMQALLRSLSERVARCPLGTAPQAAAPPVAGVAIPLSRREQLLTEAIRLFDERGYHTVNNEDIGEACGMSGPNVYNHFDAKIDLLVTAITRGFDRRGLAARQGLARATGSREAFGNLLRAHIAFALEDGHLIGAMVTELGHLPDNVRRACVQEQRDYLDLWVRVLDAVRPGLDEAQARITISAAMTIVANAARTGRFRHRTDLADRLAEMCTALLLDTSAPDEVVAVAGTATTVG